MDELKEDINADITQDTSAQDTEKKASFEKMSKANLAKQDKKLLLSFADEKGLIKELTQRQKERLTRKELADLIKPTKAKTQAQEKQETAQSVSEIELYQDAIISALNGDTARLDVLAQKNILEFIAESSNAEGEQSEQFKKIVKISKLTFSIGYLGVKFSGGVKAWKERLKNVIAKIKNKKKA